MGLFRIQPAMPVQAYRTFSLRKPPGVVGERPATCAEVQCEAYLNGWLTTLPATNADLIAEVRKRPKSQYEERGPVLVDGMLVVQFAFKPGSPCFRQSTHRVEAKDWEPLYIVRDGDWRRNLGLVRRHTRGDHWAEDAAETTERGFRRMRQG